MRDIGQPRLRLDAVEPCRSDQGVERRRSDASGIAAGKEPVFSAQGHRPDLVFSGVVADLELAVIEVARQRSPRRAGIADGASRIAFAGDHRRLRIEPGREVVDFRPRRSLAHIAPQPRWLAGDKSFDVEQRANPLERLLGDRRAAGGVDVEEAAPHMSPPGDFRDAQRTLQQSCIGSSASDIIQSAEAGITIGKQPADEARQFRGNACLCDPPTPRSTASHWTPSR